MSRINGDKSRFHRERKQNIQRRLRTKALLAAQGIPLDRAEPLTAAGGAASKRK